MKFVIFLLLIIVSAFLSCSKSQNEDPIPKSHPAYDFYQIAKRGPTTLDVCESYGGKEIVPNDYKTIENLSQGVFKLEEISTGKKFLGISFGEGQVLVTIRTCCWVLD